MRSDTLIASILEQRESLLRRVAVLNDAQWDLVCPAPAPPADVVRLDDPQRTIREVVAHVLVVDTMVLRGATVRPLAPQRRLEHPGAWDLRRIHPLTATSPTELVSLLEASGKRFARLVDSAPAPVRRVPVRGPFGRQPLARLITRRVLHEWLHEHDIAAATGATADQASLPTTVAVAEALADALLQLLPGDVLPRTGLNDGVVRLVLDLGEDGAGGVRRGIWGLDFERRHYGPRVVRPADAAIRLHAATLALLAHGRSDRLGPDRCVEVEGDSALAARLLQALGAPRVPAPCLGVDQAATAR